MASAADTGRPSSIPAPPATTALAPPPSPSTSPPLRTLNDRLSLPLPLRLPLACAVASFSGLMLGIAKGSQDTGLRFTAENAHRLPTTQAGWFLYHKSKNYNMMLGGIIEGMKQAARLGAWVGMYFVLEEGVDRGRAAGVRLYRRVLRDGEYKRHKPTAVVFDDPFDYDETVQEKHVAGNRDCVSSMLAGLGTAGIFSAWNRFPLPTAARTARMGAKAGLAFGLLQDALSLVKGRRVGYVDFIKRHTIGVHGDDEEQADMVLPPKTLVAATHLP